MFHRRLALIVIAAVMLCLAFIGFCKYFSFLLIRGKDFGDLTISIKSFSFLNTCCSILNFGDAGLCILVSEYLETFLFISSLI